VPDLIDSVRAICILSAIETKMPLARLPMTRIFIAQHAPMMMIFAPCRNGVTHNNKEFYSLKILSPDTMFFCTP